MALVRGIVIGHFLLSSTWVPRYFLADAMINEVCCLGEEAEWADG